MTATSAPLPAPVTLAALTEGQHAQGFVARAVYADDGYLPRGARFIHERTRFVFDYLAIESAPQAFVYATTYPSSDSGAAHTQEHLLLGKGNKGRWLGNYDHVMLARSSAGTWPFRTGYHFRTAAGTEAFWAILRTHLDALLHPDYSDEEIRREVRNFGVDGPDGSRALDERGTVYSEMVRTTESGDVLGWDALGRLVYGADHPLALSSGGTPEGIRGLTPEAIRRFHREHYQLANMGMVGAFPAAVPLATVLARVGEALDALAPDNPATQPLVEADLPPAHGEPGALRVVDYPSATADQPGGALLGWPATRHLDVTERTLMEMFLAAFAGGEGSTLYGALVDNRTRTLDVGATSVWAYSSEDPGQPVFLGAGSVGATHTDEASLRAVRALVQERLQAIAAWTDGSPELAAFGERVKARVVEARRRLDKALDTPPRFGDRGLDDFWLRHLVDVGRGPGFRKSLTQKLAYDHALATAGARANPWRERLKAWGLLEAPCGVMTRASLALRKQLDQGREARVAAELARLESGYGTQDAQEALRRRAAELAEGTAQIARAEAEVPMPPFVSDPPMTLDDALSYRVTAARGVPLVVSTFETMKSATVGLALRLDGVAEADLPYLAVLPSLLRDVGVLRGGVPVPYDAMNDRLRREILDLGVTLDTRFSTRRAELLLTGSGDDVEETKRALGWMADVLAHPDWRPENLARIRDVVRRAGTQLQSVTSGSEEYWLAATAEAYRAQGSSLLAHTSSFLTRAHDAFRLSWRMEGPDAAASRVLAALAPAGKKLNRAGLTSLAQALAKVEGAEEHTAPPSPALAPWLAAARALSPASRALVRRAGDELGLFLADLPDDSLAPDWEALCSGMAQDVARDPRETLAGLQRVLRAVAHAGNARVWMVGSTRTQEALAGDLDALLASLDATPSAAAAHPDRDRVTERARGRGALFSDARIAALVNPATANAGLVDSAPTAGYGETREGALIDLLTANVFSGSGGHSFYKRIWGAALAYSGYVSVSPQTARMALYSDRCADLPALLRFVEGEVRRAPADPRFVEYAVANAFYARTGDTYEDRAQAMATDLAEGVTPERVRDLRARLLALRTQPGLAELLHARLSAIYGPIIPAMAGAGPLPDGALWFAMGPEAQLARFEAELRGVRDRHLTLLRLYPRDFWDFPYHPQ